MLPDLRSDASRRPRGDPQTAATSSFLRACVLLLLHERPAHGYELLERVQGFGFDAGDSGWLYRILRTLERDRLCASDWTPSPAGPRRRTYHLLPSGEEALASSVDALRASMRAMENYLDRYVVARLDGCAPSQVVQSSPARRRDP